MLNFTKMHGLGNDFILIEEKDYAGNDYDKLAQKICNRRTGVGADGILIVSPSEIADIKFRIINSDGSEAEMCGNGIRCFAKYVYERGIVKKTQFKVETKAGIMEPKLIIEGSKVTEVCVDMGRPKFNRADIPMQGKQDGQVIAEPIDVNGTTYEVTSMFMGVPHTMVFVDDAEKIKREVLGPQIETHEKFPAHTNVNFVQILDKNNIKVRTWERGAGATLACGTGACASAVASFINSRTERNVTVHMILGSLKINYDEASGRVFMTGPATEVFSGTYDLKSAII